MERFIYVFGEDAKNTLISLGYTLLKKDIKQEIYVFENSNDLCFELNSWEWVFSDILTF